MGGGLHRLPLILVWTAPCPGVVMSTGTSGAPYKRVWTQSYKAALFELDANNVSDRIAEAKTALVESSALPGSRTPSKMQPCGPNVGFLALAESSAGFGSPGSAQSPQKTGSSTIPVLLRASRPGSTCWCSPNKHLTEGPGGRVRGLVSHPHGAQRKTRGRADRYSLLVRILRPLLHAGSSRRTPNAMFQQHSLRISGESA
jgi:hypothetical protein